MILRRYGLLIQKIIGSIAPVIWGASVWFMGWGMGSVIMPYYFLNYITQVVVAVFVVSYFFGSALQEAYRKYQPMFFENIFLIPSWVYFVGLAVVAALLSATPLSQYEFVSSLIRGVIVSAILEELIARSFFVKYKMNVKEFIIFNLISSLVFTLMHSFYVQEGVGLSDLLQRGHFGFSFMLGVIVYKTQRIELSILLHMLSNLFRYTIPVCLFQCPCSSTTAIIGSLCVDIVMLLVLGGCSSKNREIA